MSQEAKKEHLTRAKNKSGQIASHSIKEEASKTPVHAPIKRPEKPSLEPFKKKYGSSLNFIENHLAEIKIRNKTHPPAPDKGEHYEPSKFVLMDVDPYRLHAYWEIIHRDRERVLIQPDGPLHLSKLIMRVYDVTYLHFDGSNAHSYFDIEIDKDKGNWYIDLWSTHKSLCAEIGMKSSRDNFYPIVRSNVIETPRAYQSSSDEVQWMKVIGEYEEISLLSAKPRRKEIGSGATLPREDAVRGAREQKEMHFPPLQEQERIEGTGTPSQKEKETLEQHLRETYSPRYRKQIHSEEISPTAKESSPPITPHPHEGKTPLWKKIAESEIKNYYQKILLTGRRQREKTLTSQFPTPYRSGGMPSDGKLEGKLISTARRAYYSSDIRWKEEVIRLSSRMKKP